MTGERRIFPPVYFLVAMLVMVALHVLFPVAYWGGAAWAYVGVAIIAGSLGFMVASARLFDKLGTTIKPFEESSTLAVTGPFKYSRNPMYLGMVGMLAGLVMVLGTVSPVIVVPVFGWLMTTRFIVREEQDLAARFGEHFADYKRRVRRWL